MLKVALLSLIISTSAWAEFEITSKGELRMESRFFPNDDNALTEDFGYGLAGRLEVDNSWNNLQSRMQIFSRVDRKDPTRQRLNIEELQSQYVLEDWIFYAGYKTLNWSTAEAFHPTDVINSRNFDGPVENAEKLGELMAGFQFLSDFFNFNAFFMPTLARPQLPSQSNRLSFAPQSQAFPVGDVQFVNKEGEIQESSDLVEQWALRAQIPVNNWEFNLYWVHHFDRTDFAILNDTTTSQFIPLLTEVDHYGLSLQYVWESWIFKSENVYRNFQETTNVTSFGNTLTRYDYGMSALALEYLMSHSSGSETSFIVEYQKLYGVEKSIRYIINPFQNDLFVGIRHALNDEKGKEFFVGVIADVERSKELLISANYTQRLSDVWKIKLGGRYIDAPPVSNTDFTGIRALNRDHQLDINLSRFF